MVNQAAIQEVVRRIVARANPSMVIPFGSHARGQGGPRSDVDLLVVFDDEVDVHETTGDLYESHRGVGVPTDIVVVSRKYVERARNMIGTVVYPASREGKVVYQRAA